MDELGDQGLDFESPAAAGAGMARAAGFRRAAAVDADEDAPIGCTLRRHKATRTRAPSWRGVLHQDKTDAGGHRTKSCGWGFYTSRSVEEAKREVLEWLRDYS